MNRSAGFQHGALGVGSWQVRAEQGLGAPLRFRVQMRVHQIVEAFQGPFFEKHPDNLLN